MMSILPILIFSIASIDHASLICRDLQSIHSGLISILNGNSMIMGYNPHTYSKNFDLPSITRTNQSFHLQSEYLRSVAAGGNVEPYIVSTSEICMSMLNKSSILQGEIIVDNVTIPISNATVYIRLEDVSIQDAPTKVISEQIIGNVSYDPSFPPKITFQLNATNTNNQAMYAVSVLVDINGDGVISSGDFVNTESYPVLTHGYSNNVSIHVSKVS